VEGRIVDVRRDGESGDVSALLMESGQAIEADLFIDCSGFAGLLIEQALETGFEDWSHWLPCDRALAVPCARVEAPIPYTRATARRAGWQWRIPLQHRTGNGLVYSSAHMGDDAAAALLLANLDGAAESDPRPLRFKAGMRRKAFHHNVVAVGLSGGFLEPLESTSIHLVQSAISRLLKMLPGRTVAPADRDEFNRQTAFEYQRIRDFIILHYKATERDDSAFWRDCRAMAVPDTLAHKIALYSANGQITREHEELFTEVGWLQVFEGQGIAPAGHHPLAGAISSAELAEFLDAIERLNAREVAQMPPHTAFLANAPAMEKQVAQ
jgi:tryptophan halogenase